MKSLQALIFFTALHANHAFAEAADVLGAKADCDKRFTCKIWATIQHPDEGWNHYANAFEIASKDGQLIATRILRHPHIKEQPFTRSIESLTLPEGTTVVNIRAKDSFDEAGGKTVSLPIEAGAITTAADITKIP